MPMTEREQPPILDVGTDIWITLRGKKKPVKYRITAVCETDKRGRPRTRLKPRRKIHER